MKMEQLQKEELEDCGSANESCEKQNTSEKNEAAELEFASIKLQTLCGAVPGCFFSPEDFNKSSTNNHHVVPIGVLVVLFTIYLGLHGIKACLITCSDNEVINDLPKISENLMENTLCNKDQPKSSQLVQSLLEHEGICQNLEVFTKTSRKAQSLNADVKQAEIIIANRLSQQERASGDDDEGNSGSGSGSGHCGTRPHTKHAKSEKKELTTGKKSSTAEPIIYLFALVFVYLLLKAASDINQHYKSQNKSDKRLRRCSLQSYAQTHRPDRRASKELAIKQKQQQRTMAVAAAAAATFARAASVERAQQQSLPMQSTYPPRHRLIEGAPPHRTPPPTPPLGHSSLLTRSTNNWQLLRQHMTQSVDNSDISAPHAIPEFAPLKSRRCSVPAALNYQQRQLMSSAPIGMLVNDSLTTRRTSISATLDSMDSLNPNEPKRRVRMINRH